MTSPISPISIPAVPAVPSTQSQATKAGSIGASGIDRAAGTENAVSDFAGAIGAAVSNGLTKVGQLEQAVTEASRQAAVGDLESVSDYMIATAEAQLATEITVAVRDRAVTAFNDIMRMQI